MVCDLWISIRFVFLCFEVRRNYVYGASLTLNIGIQQDFPCLELFLVSTMLQS